MGRTIRAAIIVVALASLLTVGTVAADARVVSSTPTLCKYVHIGAVGYCQAVEHRVAIRTVRQLQRLEVQRTHANFRVLRNRLGWSVARLKAANHWERSRLKRLRSLPTYVPVERVPQWICIHGHEAAWDDTGDPYWGGLQMDRPFMLAYGRDMLAKYHGRYADAWTPRDQMIVANRAYDAGRGFYPWPNTAAMCGYI